MDIIAKKVPDSTPKAPKNFHPCVEAGNTCATAPFSIKRWSKIGWRVFFQKGSNIAMQCYFYDSKDAVDARATFYLNINTGSITEFMFENNYGINPLQMESLSSSNITFERRKAALKDVQKLANYFCEVNAIEYQKALEPRPVIVSEKKSDLEGYAFIGQFAKKVAKKPVKEYKQPEYDPTAPKKPVYVGSKPSGKPRHYQVEEWEVHGFYRRTKKGLVYIPPHTRRRHKAM